MKPRTQVLSVEAAALGGGGYPHVAPQRNEQYVSGDFAWNQVANAPAPGPRFVADRVHQLWITPQGDRILPLHGRVVPVTDLYVAVGQSPTK